LPDELDDTQTMSEFFSEMLSYAPTILSSAVHKGDEFERFKLTLKFAFSIVHNVINHDVKKRPIVPIVGETYEGHYILNGIHNVFMESNYLAFTYIDLLSLQDVEVKVDQPTTYILVEGHRQQFKIYGNLTYATEWKGNNYVIKLLGSLKVQFFDLEGDVQVVEI